GAVINTWVGLAVFIVLTLFVAYFSFFRSRNEPPPRVAPVQPTPAGEQRILVIANETVGGDALCDLVVEKAGDGKANVLVVAPALATPLQHLTSHEEPGREEAKQRLDASLARLREHRVSARGAGGGTGRPQGAADA